MKIIPLSEGAFTVDKTKLFIPFDTDADDLQKRAAGSLLVEVQPFVIVTSKDILLLDTGLGFEKNCKKFADNEFSVRVTTCGRKFIR